MTPTSAPDGIDHPGDAEALRRHRHDDLRHRRLRPDQRQPLAPVHEFGHLRQLQADAAARMQAPEVVAREAALFHDGHGERVAEGEHHRRRGRRRDPDRAGLVRRRQDERNVGAADQPRPRRRRDADGPDVEALQMLDDRQELRRLAGIRDQDDDVVPRDHAHVAMRRLGRMQEEGGRAGRGERGGDLRADMAGLAEAADDRAALHAEQRPDRLDEIAVEAPAERADPGRLDRDDVAPRSSTSAANWSAVSPPAAISVTMVIDRKACLRSRSIRGRFVHRSRRASVFRACRSCQERCPEPLPQPLAASTSVDTMNSCVSSSR